MIADLLSNWAISQPSTLTNQQSTPAPARDKRWQLSDADLLYFFLVIASNQLFRGHSRMTTRTLPALVAVVVTSSLSLAAQTGQTTHPRTAAPGGKPPMAVAHKSAAPTQAAEPQPELVKQYCTGCHSDKGKAGGLSLVSFDAAHADQTPEVAEKMIRELRLGM